MTQALTEARPRGGSDIVERVVVQGDLSRLEPLERVAYYRSVCESLGLNPLTKPFEYITLNGKLTLYARRDATDQLRQLHGISVEIVGRDFLQDAGLYVVTARAVTKDGRTDESIGAVNVKGLAGENMANALMKAETKAKRRVTLSVAGLGWMDESEVGSVPSSGPVNVDIESGEIKDPLPAPTRQRTPANGHGGPSPDWWTEFNKEMRVLGLSPDMVVEAGDLSGFNRAAVEEWMAENSREWTNLLADAVEASQPT